MAEKTIKWVDSAPYLDRLRACAQDRDPEGAHADADDVLCDFISALGYAEVVQAWDAIDPKWYA